MEARTHAQIDPRTRPRAPHPRIILSTIASVAIGIVLILALVTLLNNYLASSIASQEATYANIVRNIAISIENEVSQTEQSLLFFINTKDFHDALVTFTDEDRSWPLNRISLLFCVYYSQVIENMVISTTQELSSAFWSLRQKAYTKAEAVSQNEFAAINVYLTNEDPTHAYLGITVSKEENLYVTAMLSMDLMHQRLISHINIDSSTDILVQNSSGMILMSSDAQIIGKDARAVHEALLSGGAGAIDGLEPIMAHQMAGQEGSESYVGNWLNDAGKPPSRKLLVYTPARTGDGFIIINAIIDYHNVLQPLRHMFSSMTLLVIAISLVFIGLVVYLYISGTHKQAMEKENRYLQELNRTLKLANENQRMKNHQQRLEIIGMMTCGIAHEFNNLLTPIMAYSKMLLLQKSEVDADWDDVKEIYDASEKAKEIIQQISAFGRLNTTITYHQIGVSDFLDQLTRLAHGLMPPNVQFACAPVEGQYYVFGNETQLTQVVLNLILNGIDAINTKRGSITVSFVPDAARCKALEPALLDGERSTRYGAIRISDDGSGMDELTQQQIFKPFFTTKEKKGGSGLGLLISENIISAHHGRILVSSQLKQGTVFTILLPVSDRLSAAPPLVPLPSMRAENNRPLQIMAVIEVQARQAFFAKGRFKRNCKITTVGDSAEALKALGEQPYRVLVVDDALERINWSRFVMEVRKTTPALTIILLITTITKTVIEAVSTGIIDAYLLKPTTVSDLEAKIADVHSSLEY